eukprot:6804683-Ditylum_brightwellii.AAC.1
MGFKQCQADQCIRKRDGVIIIVYVDDCLILADNKQVADKIVDKLGKKFDITDEGETIEGYLGIKIDHNQDGSFR